MQPPATPHTLVPWHAKDTNEVLRELRSFASGLSAEEARRRRGVYGKNEFTKKKRETLFSRLFVQLRSPMVLVLLGAFLLTLALREFVDASVIAFALGIAVVLGLIQEGRASKAFEKLAHSQVQHATVLRGGERHVVRATELVPGDVVILESGIQVPADIRLFESKKLSINEAVLTGEWLPVKKDPETVPVGAALSEKTDMAWMGTFVIDGHGEGVVVATGDDTAVGAIAEDVGRIEDAKTPLQEESEHVSQIMLAVIGALTLCIFGLGLLRGEELGAMFLTAIAIAVAAVPEGLPAAVTIVLAVAMESLLRRGGLVRSLLAAETLGSTSIILTDKTGTLTEATMAVTAVVTPDGVHAKLEDGAWRHPHEVRDILDTALCATEAFIEETKRKDSLSVRGEPMERAILEAAYYVGVVEKGESMRASRVDYLAFSSENRLAAGLAREQGGHRLCVNGAPEYLLEEATHVHGAKGPRKMTAAERTRFFKQIDEHTERGERLIAVSYRDVPWREIPEDEEGECLPRGGVFMGLLVFHDPIRKDVKSAIADVKRAGVRVALLTGDNAKTALSVARTVGIAKKNDTALTGGDIETMDDEALLAALKKTAVFARVLPRQKMRLATVLQKSGEVVGMSGDGVNDAPALRKANIGIAVGSGTEVAKEASDLVLVHDSFEIVRAAIEEGRRVFSNLRKIIGYLFSTSLSEVALVGSALLVGAPVPILPAQILWANIIEEGLMSVAFAFEPKEPHVMRQRPEDIRRHGILSPRMLAFVGLVVFVTGGLLIALYTYLRSLGLPLSELRSVMFLAVSVDSLFIAFSFRSLTSPLWKIDPRSNLFFLLSFSVSLTLLLVVLTIPFFQFLLSYEPVPLSDMLLVLLFGFVTLATIEVGKWAFFERQ